MLRCSIRFFRLFLVPPNIFFHYLPGTFFFELPTVIQYSKFFFLFFIFSGAKKEDGVHEREELLEKIKKKMKAGSKKCVTEPDSGISTTSH